MLIPVIVGCYITGIIYHFRHRHVSDISKFGGVQSEKEQLNYIIKNIFKYIPNCSYLVDVGSSDGATLDYFSKHISHMCQQFIGIELCPITFQMSQHLSTANVRFIHKNIFDFDPPDAPLPYIYITCSHHFINYHW